MERDVPEAVRKKREAEKPGGSGRSWPVLLGPLRKSLPGSLRLIVPGQPLLEYSAGAAHPRSGDAELKQLEAVGAYIGLLDLARTAITDEGPSIGGEDAQARPAWKFRKPTRGMRG